MKRLLFLSAIILYLTTGTAGGQVLPFTHYTPENELNPLPSAEVTRVFQDEVGFMWFAVFSSGIVRYDGVQMQVYGLADGLTNLYVWDLNQDSTGRLWVSSNAGLVVSAKPLQDYQAGEKIRFTNRVGETELLNAAVNHNKVSIDTEGRIWVGTESLGLVRYQFREDYLHADTLLVPNESEASAAVRSITARRDGSVWAALVGGTLLKFEDDAIAETYQTTAGSIINTLYESPDGTLFGATSTGRVWRLTESENGTAGITYFNSVATSNIPQMMLASDGLLWVASEGSGLQKFDPESGELISASNRSNGLLAEIIYSLHQDNEDNIWIAQSGGASKLRYNFRAFLNLTATSFAGEKPVLPSPSVNSVISSRTNDSPCTVWAGTSEGGVTCINENFDSEFISTEHGLSGNWVNGLAYDESGRIWIGTSRGLNSITFGNSEPHEAAITSESIVLFDTDAVLSDYQLNSILAATTLSIREEANTTSEVQSLWFPAFQAVYAVLEDRIVTLDISAGLPQAIFNSVAYDGEHHLWVGTRDRGIYRSTSPVTAGLLHEFENGDADAIQFELWWSTENGAPSNQIEKMLWHAGSMWVGTPMGLAVLDAPTAAVKQLITVEDGLRASNATSFAISPLTGMLWLGTNQGLAEIEPETRSVLRTVTRLDGLVDNEVWFYGSVHIDDNGTIYYGTARGISIYRPELDTENLIPPVLKLTNFTSRNVPGERNEFIFEYAALSFGNERQIRYQTRLLGFSDEWSPYKQDTRVNVTNLPAFFLPKTYTFEVRAVNESGIASQEPVSFSFSVDPPKLLTWWAFLIYFVLLAISIYQVDRIQTRRLIKKERETAHLRETELKAETAMAKSRTAEAQAKALQAENDLKAAELEKARELEIAYHELKSTQTKLIQAEKMASLGRLSTGIAHEIKNPLNFITNFSQVSKELVEELGDAIASNDEEEIKYILDSLTFNTQKIDEHGKRADAIVRSMMQHSRGGQGEFEQTEINQLIKEFGGLAYHGKKSRNNSLEVEIQYQLDTPGLKVDVIPQKVGQVLQNIIENGIDSVWEYKGKLNGEYKPQIAVRSREKDGFVEILIEDNGPGIPDSIKEKIFEPFFTTKPTGEGTGLGLSLSYDFITQIHSGRLELADSGLGGAAFLISLPLNR